MDFAEGVASHEADEVVSWYSDDDRDKDIHPLHCFANDAPPQKAANGL
jgi:hypothetical protein